MNALKFHCCKTSLLSQAALKHVVSKDFIFKKSVQGTSLYPAKNEEIYGIAPYYNFSCHVTLLLNRKLQHVAGSQVGRILQVCGSTGSYDPFSTLYSSLNPPLKWDSYTDS